MFAEPEAGLRAQEGAQGKKLPRGQKAAKGVQSSPHTRQRVRNLYRGETPSSARQLPILAALHAEVPTLSEGIVPYFAGLVKGFL